MMADQGNTHAAIARRIGARFHCGGPAQSGIDWWAARHPADGWIVTSRIAGQVPTEARDGARFSMVVGPFSTRRLAHGARLAMRGEP